MTQTNLEIAGSARFFSSLLKDINIDTLEAAIRYGLAAQNEKGKLMK
jgi:hypothetical protein